MLFRPFNLEVWMVMGFTAWLARLWDNAGMGGGNKWRNGINVDQDDTDFILRRGADRWEVGDFDRWGLGGIVTIAFILPALFLVIPIAEGGLWRGIGVFGAVMLGLLGVGLGIAATLVNFWTDQFVVPIMYKRGLTILDGWRTFLPLLQKEIAALFLYALFYLALAVGVGLAVLTAGLVTCCVGWLVLAIPYIGTVIMLPVYVTGRVLGPEYLGQFGGEYGLWDDDAVIDESAEPAPPVDEIE